MEQIPEIKLDEWARNWNIAVNFEKDGEMEKAAEAFEKNEAYYRAAEIWKKLNRPEKVV